MAQPPPIPPSHPPSHIHRRTIPTELGELADLETLLLNSNKLCDDIPTELAKLVNETAGFSFTYSDNHIGTACCVAIGAPAWTCEPTAVPSPLPTGQPSPAPTMEVRPSGRPSMQPTIIITCDDDTSPYKCKVNDDNQVSTDCGGTRHDLACRLSSVGGAGGLAGLTHRPTFTGIMVVDVRGDRPGQSDGGRRLLDVLLSTSVGLYIPMLQAC